MGVGLPSREEKNECCFRIPKKKKFIYKILTSLTGHGTSCGIYFKPISLLPFIQKINLLTSYMTYIFFFSYR